MADFFNQGWAWFISLVSLAGMLGYGAICIINYIKSNKESSAEPKTQGHVWDGNLEELDTPIPTWWIAMLVSSVVFGLFYLVLYPGLGSFSGILGWSQNQQYTEEVERADELYSPLFAKFASQDVASLSKDPQALKTGKRLYQTNCAVCHGSDARGAKSFPNLRDKDWLYGGEPETIEQTIFLGRSGLMPGWDQVLGREGSWAVAEYVLSLSQEPTNPDLLEEGKKNYEQLCVSCHGDMGEGNQALGAPNLTDEIWLYGHSHQSIVDTIRQGRNGIMPAFEKTLGKDKVHVLAAYIYSLSDTPDSQ